MIDRIKHNIKKAWQAECIRLKQAWGLNETHERYDVGKAREALRISELKEDYTQSVKNTQYLRSVISVLNSNLVHKKTKAEKLKLTNHIKWYESKLNEEINNVKHFKSQLS